MSLRLRHLRLRAETPEGRFGADIPFDDGLVVLRADNSRGKSTSIKGILFALGLEKMVSTSSALALTSAMRDTLIFDFDSKAETPVVASWVSLEIANDHEIVTLTRWVKDENVESGLVRVERGPSLSDPGEYASEDFYVGRSGSAAKPRGFHRWLATFIGWEMPELPARDGRMAPLYIEQVFPLLFVEQRRGWGGIQAQMPIFSGVSDVRRKSIEFLLDLEAGKLESQRQQLRAEYSELGTVWATTVKEFQSTLAGRGLATVGLPESMTLAWPPPQEPFLAENDGTDWKPIDDLLPVLKKESQELASEPIPTTGESASKAEEQLVIATEELDSLRQESSHLRRVIMRDREELASVNERIAALRDDLTQHQDVVTLRKLGSPELEALDEDCPVCHRALPDSLIEVADTSTLASPEDTVAYIKQQLDLFTIMERDGNRTLEGQRQRWAAMRSRASELRKEIRALRSTLTSNDETPSNEAIARRIRLEDRIENLSAANERYLGLLGHLEDLASEARRIKGQLDELPRDHLSAADKSKLQSLETSFLEQLGEYDFGSFSDERLNISLEDYHPRREDFNLEADISASDSIRVVWAYLLGLMEVSSRHETNHPGLVIFDEPRQQSAKDVSFEALLKRASADAQSKQIVFATSEPLDSLREMLAGVSHSLHTVDGFLLKRLVD